MTKEQIIEKLAEIIETQEDLAALKSLIEERKQFILYRGVERDFYFGEKGEES